MRVYLAGPYSIGDHHQNVVNMILVADQVLAKGHIPFVSLLSHFWDEICPHPPEFWYSYDFHWLDTCDAILRLPGESWGADQEVRKMQEKELPVYYRIEDIPDGP